MARAGRASRLCCFVLLFSFVFSVSFVDLTFISTARRFWWEALKKGRKRFNIKKKVNCKNSTVEKI